MSDKLDLDRVFLLLSVIEKAAAHGPKYGWIANEALAELNSLDPSYSAPAEQEEEVA